jgi:PAS domain S-box-containing protein
MVSSSSLLFLSIAAAVFLTVAVFLALLLYKARSKVRQQRALTEHFENIIDSANEGMYVTDRDRRFLVWNGAAERITGYRKQDILNRFCHDNILCHTDRKGTELCRTRCPLNHAMDSGMSRGPEIVFLRRSDGIRIPVEVKTAPLRDAAGRITGGVEIFQDVTARIEQERLLRERKAKLETVLDSIGDGLLFLDTTGVLSVFNHACSEMFGMSKALVGSALHALPEGMLIKKALSFTERDYAFFTARYEIDSGGGSCPLHSKRFRCWNEGIGAVTADTRPECYTCTAYLTKKTFLENPREMTWGDRTYSVVSSFIEMWETNELWEIMTFRDVTAAKLDAALKTAGAAAHELRQPLQVVMMLAQYFKKERQGDRAVKEYIDMLESSCSRMDKIIRQMGDITAYRTKEYVEGARILDIDHSVGNR